MRTALLHIGGSILVGQLAVPGLTFVLTAGGAQVYALVAIFAVGFPALTYCFLASIWLIRSVQASFRHR